MGYAYWLVYAHVLEGGGGVVLGDAYRVALARLRQWG
jgi:hypothetical protein